MKTRVTEHYDTRFGIYCYRVWKWDLWDAPDLRAAYPDKYDWRPVIYLPDRERCVSIAKQLASPNMKQDVPMVDLGDFYQPRLVPLVAEFEEGC